MWCGKHNLLAFRCNVGKILTAQNTWFDTGLPEGFPDLLILGTDGDIYFCEVKNAKGRQREDQKRFQKIVTERGFKYMLPHSLDEFIEQLKSFGKNY